MIGKRTKQTGIKTEGGGKHWHLSALVVYLSNSIQELRGIKIEGTKRFDDGARSKRQVISQVGK